MKKYEYLYEGELSAGDPVSLVRGERMIVKRSGMDERLGIAVSVKTIYDPTFGPIRSCEIESR